MGLLLAVTIVGPLSGGADALRVQDSVMLAGKSTKSFEKSLNVGETTNNTTVFLPINASAKITSASLVLGGRFDIPFINLSGRGTAASTGEEYGRGVHGGGDYNDDGFQDLAVGAYGENSAAVASRVEIFYGSSTGIRGHDANWSYAGPVGSGFGWSIVHGDYNSDGIDDLVVGESDFFGAPVETVYVFYGSGTGLPASPDLSLVMNSTNLFSWGYSLVGGQDLDNDGFDDLVVGEAFNSSVVAYRGTVCVLWGDAGGLNVSNATFLTGFVTSYLGSTTSQGLVLEGLGDTDGDGFGEFAVGTPANTSSSGAIEVFESDSVRALTRVWSYTNNVSSYFGWAVAGGLDISGDGVPDLAVGAPTYGATNGAVYVFNGTGSAAYSNTPLILRPTVTTTVDQFGAGVDMLPDFDGDGKSDLAVGANAADNFDGRLYLYRAFNMSTAGALLFRPNSTGLRESFGWFVASGGDLNNDGKTELAAQMASGINGTFTPGSLRTFYGTDHFYPENLKVFVNKTQVWNYVPPLQGNLTVTGLGGPLQAYLDGHQADANATGFVWIPISFNFSLGGKLNISSITANYTIVQPPEGVNATAPAVGGAVVVSWSLHPTDGTVYSVWSNKTGAWEWLANVSLPRTFYNDTNVSDGVRYYYYVTEWDPSVPLQSAPSGIVSAIPVDTTPPTAPTSFSLNVNATAHTIRLQWLPNLDDTQRYEVWRRDGDAAPFVNYSTVLKPAFNFSDPGLLEEVNYSYQVRAVDDAGLFSGYTAILTGRIPDLTPPSAPLNLVGVSQSSGTAIDITWSPNTGDTVGYAVLRSTTNLPGSFTEILQTGLSSATVGSLTRNQHYYFQVVAIDKVDLRSTPSATADVLTVDTLPPSAPVLDAVTTLGLGNTVAVNWSATGDDLASFRIYTNVSGTWVMVAQVGAVSRSAFVNNLTDGVPAYFRVSAVDLGGLEGPYSNIVSGIPTDTQKPGAPPTTTATAVAAGAIIVTAWTAPNDADVARYNVYFLDPTVGSDYFLAGTVLAPNTNFTHRNLTNGVTYRYRVAAVDEVGNEGPFGPDAVGVPRDTIAPSAPVLVAGTLFTNVVNQPLSGTAEPNSLVEIWVRGALQSTVSVDATGHFVGEARLIRGDNEIHGRTVDPSLAIDVSYKFSANSQELHITLDPDRPTVQSTVPGADQLGVDTAVSIVVILSEAVRNDSIVLTVTDADGNAVAGNMSYDATAHRVSFTPAAALKAGTVYRAQLSASDLAGNLLSPFTLSFTTRAATTTGGGGGFLPAPGALDVLAGLATAGVIALAARRPRRSS